MISCCSSCFRKMAWKSSRHSPITFSWWSTSSSNFYVFARPEYWRVQSIQRSYKLRVAMLMWLIVRVVELFCLILRYSSSCFSLIDFCKLSKVICNSLSWFCNATLSLLRRWRAKFSAFLFRSKSYSSWVLRYCSTLVLSCNVIHRLIISHGYWYSSPSLRERTYYRNIWYFDMFLYYSCS